MALALKHPAAGTAAMPAGIGAGAVAGLIGGMVMSGFSMIGAAAAGESVWAPARMIASTFLGPDPTGAGAVVFGMFVHFAFSAFLGALFGLVVGRGWKLGWAVAAGVLWGAIIWAVMTWLVLPAINPAMRAEVLKSPGSWFAEHAIFGAILGLTPWLAANFARPAREGIPAP
jgi:hypothetical protein